MPPVTQTKLALQGGEKVRNKPFPAYRTIGDEEKQAANRVLDSGILSRFLGCWHDDFYGGPEVRALEQEWAEYMGVKQAIADISATSALYAAVGAIGIEPGEEIVVSPYTMSASAVAPLIYNAIPVFADIEEDYYCLSPESVASRITPQTRAIIVVDLFGQPYDADAINAIAKTHGLMVIEDCAQAPGARYKEKYSGTLADIGIYSLNYHKHIHAGEGGIIVTDHDCLAERLRLIRNHAEAVLPGPLNKDSTALTSGDLANMLGFNYRMTELEAAIAREQLKKLEPLLSQRQGNVAYLNHALGNIPCIRPTIIREGAIHSFYLHPLQFDSTIAGVHRDRFIEAVKAELMPSELREGEGVRIATGYVKPLYLQPLYQQRIAYGKTGFPWTSPHYKGQVDYSPGICPVAERMHRDSLFFHELMRPPMTREDLDDVVKAFEKVWEYRDVLRDITSVNQ